MRIAAIPALLTSLYCLGKVASARDNRNPKLRWERAGRMLAVVLLSTAALSTMLHAQAPAGPNRPAGVPENYVVTPFGYFHPSCVLELAAGDTLLKDEGAVHHADGSHTVIPACAYPRFTFHGQIVAAEATKAGPPTICNSSSCSAWIEAAGIYSQTDQYSDLAATWTVPPAPTTNDDQVIYFFPGVIDDDDLNTHILQPVLAWISGTWSIAGWDCCFSATGSGSNPYNNYTTSHSTPVTVSSGDTIQGTIESTCPAGTLSCQTWTVSATDQTQDSQPTTFSVSSLNGDIIDLAYGGALEAPGVVQCSDYPPNNSLTFSNLALYDYTGAQISNPSWSPSDYAIGETPQCNYGVQTSATQVTVDYPASTPYLAVSVVGGGSVSSSPSGISCPGSSCLAMFNQNEPVTLTATAGTGYSFSSWSNPFNFSGGANPCTTSDACNLSMSTTANTTATFTLTPETLTVSVNGDGTVTSLPSGISCPSACSTQIAYGSIVTLTPAPGSGYVFSSWSGACSGSGSTCSVTMNGAESVSATFTQAPESYTVAVTGYGTVTSSPTGISCPGVCTYSFPAGESITFTARPTAGSVFDGWSNQCSGSNPVCTTSSNNGTLRAAFSSGSFTLPPQMGNYGVVAGSSAQFTVSNTLSGGFNAPITMSSNSSVQGLTATFNPNPIPAPGSGNYTITISATTAVPGGSQPITFTGIGGGYTGSVNWEPVITNFTISASPTSVSVSPGSNGTSTITVNSPSSPLGTAISLSATGQPSGVTVGFSPSQAYPGAITNSTMTITVPSGTTAGTYPITVTGTSNGSLTHSTIVTLTIAASQGSFTLPAQMGNYGVVAGSNAQFTESNTLSGGFNAPITMSSNSSVTGLTATFSPNSIPAPGSGTYTITISATTSVPGGSQPITFTGMGGGHTATVNWQPVITNFTISASPTSVSVSPGSNGTSTITVNSPGSPLGTAISLSATGQPSGVTVGFSPTQAYPGAITNSTMTITVPSGTTAGTYPITVTGTSNGSLTHSTTVTLNVL